MLYCTGPGKGVMTLSITALSITALGITSLSIMTQHKRDPALWHSSQCVTMLLLSVTFFTVVPSVVVLIVVAPQQLAKKYFLSRYIFKNSILYLTKSECCKQFTCVIYWCNKISHCANYKQTSMQGYLPMTVIFTRKLFVVKLASVYLFCYVLKAYPSGPLS